MTTRLLTARSLPLSPLLLWGSSEASYTDGTAGVSDMSLAVSCAAAFSSAHSSDLNSRTFCPWMLRKQSERVACEMEEAKWEPTTQCQVVPGYSESKRFLITAATSF